MKNIIEIQETKIEYTHKISPRARQLKVAVYPGGRTVVTAPRLFGTAAIENFLKQKSQWLLSTLARQKLIPVIDVKASKTEYLNNKDRALSLTRERVECFNLKYGFKIGRIAIKNHKSLWGSCSRKGNLNFNYRIVLLPEEQRDYIIVHELCHLAEFNHSAKFWALVAQTFPNYRQIRKSIKSFGISFS